MAPPRTQDCSSPTAGMIDCRFRPWERGQRPPPPQGDPIRQVRLAGQEEHGQAGRAFYTRPAWAASWLPGVDLAAKKNGLVPRNQGSEKKKIKKKKKKQKKRKKKKKKKAADQAAGPLAEKSDVTSPTRRHGTLHRSTNGGRRMGCPRRPPGRPHNPGHSHNPWPSPFATATTTARTGT